MALVLPGGYTLAAVNLSNLEVRDAKGRPCVEPPNAVKKALDKHRKVWGVAVRDAVAAVTKFFWGGALDVRLLRMLTCHNLYALAQHAAWSSVVLRTEQGLLVRYENGEFVSVEGDHVTVVGAVCIAACASREEIAAWEAHLWDYKIVQPVPQLQRWRYQLEHPQFDAAAPKQREEFLKTT